MIQLVVVGCGASKEPRPTPAGRLYTGPYFTACKRAALALAPARGWRILSALHGLVHPIDTIAPYDLRMGQAGSVTVERVREQARAKGLADLDGAAVVVLAGERYLRVARAVWPTALAPLAGTGGLGHQLRVLSRIAACGRLPERQEAVR